MHDELLSRATAAFLTKGNTGFQLPRAELSEVAEIGGKEYVILKDSTGTMAVYRLRNDGSLKRLKRVPQEITG